MSKTFMTQIVSLSNNPISSTAKRFKVPRRGSGYAISIRNMIFLPAYNDHNSSGNILSQSSPLAEPLWTDPDLKSKNECARANIQ